LCFLFVEIRTMDKVQKLNSNECYTQSSEPFRMYRPIGLYEFIQDLQDFRFSQRYPHAVRM
jgi:hypothetical protein